MFCDDSCVLTITLVFRKYGVLLVCFEPSLQKRSENVVKSGVKPALNFLIESPNFNWETELQQHNCAKVHSHSIWLEIQRNRGTPKLGWHSQFSLDIEFSAASKWHSRHTIVIDNNSIITPITNTNINNKGWKKLKCRAEPNCPQLQKIKLEKPQKKENFQIIKESYFTSRGKEPSQAPNSYQIVFARTKES